MTEGNFSLVDARDRKNLAAEERLPFLAAVCADLRPAVRTFAVTLAHPRRRSLAGPTPSVWSETPLASRQE